MEARIYKQECNLQPSATLRVQSKHLFRTLKHKLTTAGQEEGMCIHTVKKNVYKLEYIASTPQLNNMVPSLIAVIVMHTPHQQQSTRIQTPQSNRQIPKTNFQKKKERCAAIEVLTIVPPLGVLSYSLIYT